MTGLDSSDRWAIDRARELAALDGDAIRARGAARTGSENSSHAYALGEAQHILARLADLAERLDGDLGEIRALLAGFDWERGDRQYALEAIERIVTGGQV